MHLRTTNKSAKTLDVHRFCFEFTSALEFDNEHSGLAVEPAHLYLLLTVILHFSSVASKSLCTVVRNTPRWESPLLPEISQTEIMKILVSYLGTAKIIVGGKPPGKPA